MHPRRAGAVGTAPTPPPPECLTSRSAALAVVLLAAATAGCIAAAVAPVRTPPPPPDGADLVVLVHGMGRTRASMAPLARALRQAGFRTLTVGYRSTRGATIESAGADVARAVRAETDRQAAPRVHLVGHSLGAIAIRWMLAHDPPANVGRVVLIAPPNQGSHAADRYAATLGRWQTPMRQLRTTARGGTVAALPAPPDSVEVAILAGDADGKVWVTETRLDGVRAHRVVRGTHTWLMRSREVQRLTAAFLRTGAFGDASRVDAPVAR